MAAGYPGGRGRGGDGRGGGTGKAGVVCGERGGSKSV
jgi:hypothetical protein